MKRTNSKLWLLGAVLSACFAAYLLVQGYVLLSYRDIRYGLCASGSGILFLAGYCICMYRFFRKPPLWKRELPSETWKRFGKHNNLQIFLAGCIGAGFAVYLCRYGGVFRILFTGIGSLILIIAVIVGAVFNRSRPLSATQRQYREALMSTALSLKEKGFSSTAIPDPACAYFQIRDIAAGRRDTFAAMAFTAALMSIPIILAQGDLPACILPLLLFAAVLLIINTAGLVQGVRAFYPWRNMLNQGKASEVFQALVSYCESCSQRWQFPIITIQMYGVRALSYMNYHEEALALLNSLKGGRYASTAYMLYNEALLLAHLKKKDELLFVLRKLHEAIPKSPKKSRVRAEQYYELLTNLVNCNYAPVLALEAQQAPNELIRHTWDTLISDAKEQVFGSGGRKEN